MSEIGYALSSEEHPPTELVRCAQRAEYDESYHSRTREDQRLTEYRQCND